MDVGLSEFVRIDGWCSRDNWDQFSRHLFGRSSSSLPALLPPCPFMSWEIGIEAVMATEPPLHQAPQEPTDGDRGSVRPANPAANPGDQGAVR